MLDGTIERTLDVPGRQPASLAFDGDDMYVTTIASLFVSAYNLYSNLYTVNVAAGRLVPVDAPVRRLTHAASHESVEETLEDWADAHYERGVNIREMIAQHTPVEIDAYREMPIGEAGEILKELHAGRGSDHNRRETRPYRTGNVIEMSEASIFVLTERRFLVRGESFDDVRHLLFGEVVL